MSSMFRPTLLPGFGCDEFRIPVSHTSHKLGKYGNCCTSGREGPNKNGGPNRVPGARATKPEISSVTDISSRTLQ
eukprot:6188807-Pleurochrysis_carterae.AAC.2